MKRSLRVTAPLLASTALALLTACKEKEMQRCVDEHDQVVADNLCQGQPVTRTEQRPDGHGGFVPFIIPMYRTYYGGYGSYDIGSRVGGGGYAPLAGHSYGTSVSRGGFGRSFSSHFGS
ncbi:hypothetical protein [Terriglobus tenax]|uniref:hypothetical protein n=1 Tax=Terriglobus tenax TaxID=1111115 RepID=UPI0021DFEBEC|nr:hypothetical protein [Terriglobus tenax]